MAFPEKRKTNKGGFRSGFSSAQAGTFAQLKQFFTFNWLSCNGEAGGQSGILVLVRRTELGAREAEDGMKVSVLLGISSKHFDPFRTACSGQASLPEECEGARKGSFQFISSQAALPASEV